MRWGEKEQEPSCFKSLIMKTKYVCHGLISPHVNFDVDRVVGTVILLVKNCRWGKGKTTIY